MIDKIIKVLDEWTHNGKIDYIVGTERAKEELAQEIHALRYESAAQVWADYFVYCAGNDRPLHFVNWLAEQGETITIDLRRDNVD